MPEHRWMRSVLCLRRRLPRKGHKAQFLQMSFRSPPSTERVTICRPDGRPRLTRKHVDSPLASALLIGMYCILKQGHPMFALGDIALGILLGLSAFLLVIALTSYRRSGVRSLMQMSVGLVLHIAFTLFVVIGVHVTDIMEGVDGMLLLVIDVVILAVAILIGLRGGKSAARPS